MPANFAIFIWISKCFVFKLFWCKVLKFWLTRNKFPLPEDDFLFRHGRTLIPPLCQGRTSGHPRPLRGALPLGRLDLGRWFQSWTVFALKLVQLKLIFFCIKKIMTVAMITARKKEKSFKKTRNFLTGSKIRDNENKTWNYFFESTWWDAKWRCGSF